jgi:RNA polymerase sigma-70 factor, ECF subfamily
MNSRQDKDMELLSSILKDNSAKANTELYTFYTDEIKKHIKKKFKLSEADSEDLTSDTLMKVISNLPEYSQDKSNFRTWVFTIAENTTINFKNKLSNRIEHEHFIYNNIEDIDSKNFIEIPSQENFEQDFYNNNTLNHITSDLDIQSKTMMEMKYVEGYSYHEIGAVYSLTSSTVSNKINYTKTKLNKRLKEK